MYESMVKLPWSKVDGKNLEKKIEEWKRESPDDFMEYTPYVRVDLHRNTYDTNGSDDEDKNDAFDDEVLVEDDGKPGLLFVHVSNKVEAKVVNALWQ